MTWPPLEPVAPLADLAEEIAAARAWAVDPTDREPRWEHQRHNVRAMTELAGG
jgi:hypothetical protein